MHRISIGVAGRMLERCKGGRNNWTQAKHRQSHQWETHKGRKGIWNRRRVRRQNKTGSRTINGHKNTTEVQTRHDICFEHHHSRVILSDSRLIYLLSIIYLCKIVLRYLFTMTVFLSWSAINYKQPVFVRTLSTTDGGQIWKKALCV